MFKINKRCNSISLASSSVSSDPKKSIAPRMRAQVSSFQRNYIIHSRSYSQLSNSQKQMTMISTMNSEESPLRQTQTFSNDNSQPFHAKFRLSFDLSQNQRIHDLLGKTITQELQTLPSAAHIKNRTKKIEDLMVDCKDRIDKALEHASRDKNDYNEVIFKNTYEHPLSNKFFSFIKSGDIKTVRDMIIENPELLRTVDSTQQTALHWACRRNNLEMAQFLVSCRANMKAVDIAGRTPEDIAKRLNHKEIYLFLKSAAVKTRRRSVRIMPGAAAYFANRGCGIDILRIKKSDAGVEGKFTKLHRALKKQTKTITDAWSKSLKLNRLIERLIPEIPE
ncbi:unnamed protein product [Blepharisma stoltei]|uniref:Ankyrin repeat domain-containing protein n=1 Tax=Blepharisma stoltei TaxID=1481888 RepID=A0AAU9JRG0_9CILI|nr:unnamed protein product [Blepharisma stoltei]